VAVPAKIRAQGKVVTRPMPDLYGFTVAAGELAGRSLAPELGAAELPGDV